jgi:hypothetical protein
MMMMMTTKPWIHLAMTGESEYGTCPIPLLLLHRLYNVHSRMRMKTTMS